MAAEQPTPANDGNPVCKFQEGCHRVVPCEPGCGTTTPAPDQTLRDRVADLLWTLTDWDGDQLNAEAAAEAVLGLLPSHGWAGVLLWAADQIDAETRQLKADEVLEPDKYRPCRDASAQLRALAAEERDEQQAPQPDTEALASADNPTHLRWGLNDVLWSDDDSVIVMMSGPDLEAYWLELDPERAAVLREDLAGPDGQAPADRSELRDRIRRAVCQANGFDFDSDMLEPDEYGDHADLVLAFLPEPVDRATILRREADRIAAMPEAQARTLQKGVTWTTSELRRMANQPAEEQLAEPPVHIGGGGNAEKCPACKASPIRPSYPWVCPGPAATEDEGTEEDDDV